MPRPPRLHVPGGFYHVILRGNHREPLFASNEDRTVLDTFVGNVISRSGARIHAYCWMTNHLHALIQVGELPLSKIMGRIAAPYSRYRHNLLRTSGHLFERRYKATLVDVDAYFLTLVRYIHLNPVKALMVSDPVDYPWSSHRAWLGLRSTPWLTIDFGLSLFSTHTENARDAYARFMGAPDLVEDEFDSASNPQDSRVLGSDSFISGIPYRPQKPRRVVTLDQLATEIATDHSIPMEALASPSRERSLSAPRLALVRAALDHRIATLAEVARFLNRQPSTLSRLLARRSTPYGK